MSKKTRKIKNQEGGRNMLSAGLAAAASAVNQATAAAKPQMHAAVASAANQATALGAAAKDVGKALVPNSITELREKYQTNRAAIDNWLKKNSASTNEETKAVVDLINLLITIENAPITIVAGISEKTKSLLKHGTDVLKTGMNTYMAKIPKTVSTKQKYLKYKQKYLELKQQLNQI
jgi:hypothetical protein